jgi:hypothetical protein
MCLYTTPHTAVATITTTAAAIFGRDKVVLGLLSSDFFHLNVDARYRTHKYKPFQTVKTINAQ